MKKFFSKDYWIVKKSGLFDPEYYLRTYPDVRQSDADPIWHYCCHGWREGRNPSALFDTNFYLNTYTDVRDASVNPLAHYCRYGWQEGRNLTSRFSTGEYLCLDKNNNVRSQNVNSSSLFCLDKKECRKQNAKYHGVANNNLVFNQDDEGFVQYKENNKITSRLKVIAFYLPQFHPFQENDLWWGKGFTEWTNVTKATPNFVGHYQPHLPIHFGFYDLRIPDVMIEQARLAKKYGIYGFNFYYYWFDGKILMHRPFEILLENKEIDINFCITWANENWTRRWDGADNDILISQNHCESDSIKFIESLYRFFNDERYIKIDGKPVLIVYRADIIPNIDKTIRIWREKIKSVGFVDLFIICSQTFGIDSLEHYGFDASMEFPPHNVGSNLIDKELSFINSEFAGKVYDYQEVVKNACIKNEPTYKLFRTAMLSWDNTARKQNNSHIFFNFSLFRYKQWLMNMALRVHADSKYSNNEKLLFINAWNEWAEGTHLEPDRKYGYGYLQTTYDVLKEFDIGLLSSYEHEIRQKCNELAVILHIHYTELWDEISLFLKNLPCFDLYVTITNSDNNIVFKIRQEYLNADIKFVENVGRDILPFIDTYRRVKDFGYKGICKIHSKKSIYRDDGDKIRNDLYRSLLGNESIISSNIKKLGVKEYNGLVTSQKYLIEHTEHNMTYNKDHVEHLARLLDIKFKYSFFPVGSMFWFAPYALNGVEKIERNYFEQENMMIDGTVAHAIERLFYVIAQHNTVKKCH